MSTWRNNLLEKLVLLRSNKLCLLVLLGVGFCYRIYGLGDNYSFWTDENHTAIFVRAILERGKPVLGNGYSTGIYQLGQYWLSAVSAKIFGLNEFAIRFPSVIFGVLTIWVVWLLGREVFDGALTSPIPQPFGLKTLNPKGFSLARFSLARSRMLVPLVAAVLITFSKIEILWSRQARPYQALQFFYVLSAYFISRYMSADSADDTDRYNTRSAREIGNLLGFLGCGVAAGLMHPLGLVILPVGLVCLLVGERGKRRERWERWGMIGVIGVIGVLGYVFRVPLLGLLGSLGKVNNLFYYRVFLWHNYSLLVFLGVVGVLRVVGEKRKRWILPVLFLGVQGFIASFLLGQPFTRYFYPVFPFLVLLAAGGLGMIGEGLGGVGREGKEGKEGEEGKKMIWILILTLFIVGMGHKFTLLPKRVYSLNEDMQEIPEVDWKKVYGFVETKLKENPDAVLVTNWNDLPVWYLGEGSLDYLTRKPGKTRLEKDVVSLASYLFSLDEFEEMVKKEKKGVFIVDSWDDRVPDGIREYVRENLKKELEVDRLYPVQPRLWPVEVYLWGI